jgi:rhodanese-related sulfurtransferase
MYKYLVIILLFIAIIFFLYSIVYQPSKYNILQISTNEARSRRFGLIIDVRTPEERNRMGYYPKSIPISLDRIAKQVPLDISNKNTHILVYSNGDDRAKVAADILYNMGYINVRHINGTFLDLLPGSSTR